MKEMETAPLHENNCEFTFSVGNNLPIDFFFFFYKQQNLLCGKL